MEKPLSILDSYLIPNPIDRQMVVLTDAGMSAAVLATKGNIVALSTEATKLLERSFLEQVPVRIKDLLEERPEAIETALSWVKDSSEDGVFVLAEKPPNKKVSAPTPIDAGSSIPAVEFGKDGGVKVEYRGTYTTAQINETTLYWYISGVSLKEQNRMLGVGYEASVGTKGPFGLSLYPKPMEARIGVHCGACKGCGVCGACGACALCGGVDFAAALIAVDATLAAVALADAISAFEGLAFRQ